MKLNTKILVVALAAIGLLSCSKNNDDPKYNGEVDVTVKIESVVSRAVVDPTEDEYQTKIKEAYAYVVDANGTVMASGKFTEGELTSGKTFAGLTSNVKDVFVIANWPSSYESTLTSIGKGSVLNGITLSMADLEPEYDDDDTDDPDDIDTHGVKYATLYNVSSTTAKANVGEDNETWTIEATLAPVVTRFEIGQVSGTAEISVEQGYSNIISYTLSGIYMNNVYPSVKLGAKTVLTHTGDKLTGTFDQTTVFPLTRPSWSFDSYDDEFEEDRTYSPIDESAELWAYHVAPIDASVAANKDDVPQIILHLTDVYFGETEAGKYKSDLTNLYVPVNGFKNKATNTTIKEFNRGEVYKIEDLEFNMTHVKPDVDPSDITVIAKVKVQGWKVNTVLPEF